MSETPNKRIILSSDSRPVDLIALVNLILKHENIVFYRAAEEIKSAAEKCAEKLKELVESFEKLKMVDYKFYSNGYAGPINDFRLYQDKRPLRNKPYGKPRLFLSNQWRRC